MTDHTVSEVARLSGVSVRTLHHYDALGLLTPAAVGLNGYRYYGREELLRLQQILFHRELGFSLEEIARLLDAPGFDRAAALKAHRTRLEADARRYRRLVRTIDETLAALEGDETMDDKAMYRGFSPERQAGYEAELVETHGAAMQTHIDDAKAKMSGWKQADFDAMQAEAEMIEAAFAVLNDERFAPVFGPGSRAEVALTGSAPGLPRGVAISGRIDRLVITPERVLVVDYKSNRPAPPTIDRADPSYVLQLAVYVAVLKRLYPDRAVEAALVWTDGPLLMEVPTDLMDAALTDAR